jgi:GNAT superfamily N-acetyltransferase
MDFELCNIKQINRDLLVDFSKRTWGEQHAKSVLSEWWFDSDHSETIVAVDNEKNRLGGIVVAVKSRWHLNDGIISNTVSICGWYVAPEYAGKGLGRLLVSYFDTITTSRNTLAISDAAVRGFKKLGWAGPFRSQLLFLPFPSLRRRRTARGNFSLKSYEVCGADLPNQLCIELNHIEKTRPVGTIRRVRDVDAWHSHLKVWPNRRHKFHIVMVNEEAIGFVLMRDTDGRAAFIYRYAKASYVTDITMNRQDSESMFFLTSILGNVASRTAGCLILCTSNIVLTKALVASGWLSDETPVIGKLLASKAPLFMLDGDLAKFSNADINMTFTDSDVDLNL